MTLQNRLLKLTYDDNQPDKAMKLLHSTDPTTASLTDLMFLLRLIKPRRNNRLAYLMLEAKMWARDNLAALKKRQTN